MKIGIIGSGAVGQAMAQGFAKENHEVMIGTEHVEKLKEFSGKNKKVKVGKFSETAAFGELIVLAAKGTEMNNIIKLANAKNFANKVVIDITNPLTFGEQGSSPKLTINYPESLGANIQKMLPTSKVVKAFNTVTASYMANAKMQEGTPDLFIAGNDAKAKKQVTEIAQKWGWTVNDIGNIEQSYMLESLAMLWITYGFLNNHWTHAFKLLKK